MGITTAVFTLAGGVMSLLGGLWMSLDIRLPFYITASMAALALVFVLAGWPRPEIKRLTERPTAS